MHLKNTGKNTYFYEEPIPNPNGANMLKKIGLRVFFYKIYKIKESVQIFDSFFFRNGQEPLLFKSVPAP